MNPRQRVIAFDESLCVTAGAGAGKTSCLVDAYVGLLSGADGAGSMDPQQVLAITFTEKAAAEMRSRVAEAVQSKFSEDIQQVERWAEVLPKLEWAPISTIHSFCVELLREYGHLLGLDPDFGILDQDAYGQLQQETVNNLLKAKLEARDLNLELALAHYRLQGRGGLDQSLLELSQAMSTSGLIWPKARERTARAHRESLAGKADIMAEIDEAVSRLATNIAADNYPKNNNYFPKINRLVEIWPQIYESILHSTDIFPRDLSTLVELTKGGWGKAKPERDVIHPAVDKLKGLAAVADAAELSDALLGLGEELAQALDVELSHRAALSFDHLLLLAVRLLQEHDSVAHLLRSRFKAVMVDEYQDINPVQGRLIDLIAGTVDEDKAEPDGPRLLLVGDRKQSIYAFRGAEVALYNQTMIDFSRRDGLVALSENFRSAHELVKFFNRLFEGVFVPPTGEDQVPGYRVSFAPEDRQEPAAKEPGIYPKPVVVLDNTTLADEGAPIGAWRELEAESLAAYISGLLEEGVKPGDIVLLFRRLTQVGVYEDALRRSGSDYFTVRGAGLYDRQEIADISMALRALLDPDDSVALAGMLRSPLVGLSDESLLALARPDAGQFIGISGALAKRQPLPDWVGPRQRDRWAKAIALFDRLAPATRRMTPADLIKDLIESTDLDAIYMATRDGRQRLANLRKLLETAREPRAGMGQSVDSFSHGLARLVADPPQDAQAPLVGEESQAVRLMTVHQAKGLEFNTVILPDLIWKATMPPIGPQIDDQGVLACSPMDIASGERRATLVLDRLKADAAKRDQAEAARLFYVAATRARERLVFCLSGSRQRGLWHDWLQDLVIGDPAVEMIRGGVLGQKTAELGSPADQWDSRVPDQAGEQGPLGREIVRRITERTAPTQTRFLESVTGLGNWLKCPRQYLFVRRMGLDTANISKTYTKEDIASRGGVQLGSLVHRALELADFSLGLDGVLPALEAAAQEHPADEETLRLAQERVNDWWKTGLSEILDKFPAPRLMREQDFRVHLPPKDGGPAIQLIGSIDLLLEWPDAQRLIVDYKVTDKIDSQPYVYQLALYALAMRASGKPTPSAALAFLAGERSILQKHRFSQDDLDQWEDTVRMAARDIVNMPPETMPHQLPIPDTCAPATCRLAGLCFSEDELP